MRDRRAYRLQLPESRIRPHFVKAIVRVHEYPDGSVSVFLGRIDWRRLPPTDSRSAPTRLSLAACSEQSRTSLAGAQARVLDLSSARRRRESAGRGGETGFKSNKETEHG